MNKKMIKWINYTTNVILIIILSACKQQKQVNNILEPNETIPQPSVQIDTTNVSLIIYYPPADSIVLRCFTRPEPNLDNNAVFCCAAAFTLDYKTEEDHKRICSAHVSEGIYYKMPRIKRNTGAFVTYNGKWLFLYDGDANPASFDVEFQKTAVNKGAGFAQEMMIHDGLQVKTTRPLGNTNLFRALCERENRLCVVDAKKIMAFGEFIKLLLDNGITEAIYTDMGYGWNYSWYRINPNAPAIYIHQEYQPAATNWLLFYPK